MASDGCSGAVSWFYEKILRKTFELEYCCDEHDLAYDEGESSEDRLLADKRFFICLWESKRYFKACFFFIAVRSFGWYYWKEASLERNSAESEYDIQK